ncbi:MAG: sugar phosphate nucleotidyltransferase, partial [Methylococcales bacterium]
MKQNWKHIAIRADDTLQETIKVIDAGALQIALVIDDQGKLIGVVTDGDIRRALIKGLPLSQTVAEVMNPQPKVAYQQDSKAKLIAQMDAQRLFQLPILDEHGKVIGLETLQDLYKPTDYANPIFLMAGGYGRRLRPFTDTCPKPLLEVGGKPILETIIENFVKSGFKHFYIAVHYLSEKIKTRFGDGSRWGADICYIDEREPLGTAGALGLLPAELPDLPMIVMNGDILAQIDFPRLLEYHNSQQGVATLCVRQYEYQIPYGVVSLDQQRITGIVEKPVHSCFSNAGVYVL